MSWYASTCGRNIGGAFEETEEERAKAKIRAALEAHRGNVTAAGDALGIGRHALNRLLKKHGLRG